MPAKLKFSFSIATLLWLMVCVAMFFGGRMSRESEVQRWQANAHSSREDASAIRDMLARNRLLHPKRRALSSVGATCGDTIVLKRENSATHGDLVYVRLAGIGCPAVEQPFGKDAKRFAIDFCKTGNVDLVGDGRPADLNVNGKSLRAALLSAGLAWHDGDHNNDSELATLQAEAKAAKRGLWADEDAVPPWEWRE